MENLKIKFSHHDHGTIYQTTFESEGSLRKLIEFLKTDKSPSIDGENTNKVLSVRVINDDEIVKVVSSQIPTDSFTRLLIGNKPLHITYNIAYNDEILVLKTKNPSRLDNLFRFNEELTVTEENGILRFERKAHVYNLGKKLPIVGQSYQKYDDIYNRRNIEYYHALSQICK